jgi:acyl-CoA oxidase
MLDGAALRRLLDGDHAELRDAMRALLSRPDFAPVSDIPRAEYRELVLTWTKEVAAAGGAAPHFPSAYGGSDDPAATMAAFEILAFGDLSVLIKMGVQFGLWGGAVLHLGTQPHHERYLGDTSTVDLPGCFAMTEVGHGSDVQNVRTTATYDPETQEFVINTPDDDAAKTYIGNAAVHGRIAAVFAQLVVAGESHGVHTLVAPLRNKKGATVPGVRIADNGLKIGLNGVDNGMIWFDGLRVPRDALLNRYGDVSADGVYTSPIENRNKRFFTMLGTLVQGRVGVGGAGNSAAKKALTIAVRYCDERRQFPRPGGEEVVLLDYRTHQRRLLPLLAKSYALHFAQDELRGLLYEVFTNPDTPDERRRELETLAAGLKAAQTWHGIETIQACREACGGAGFIAAGGFAAMRSDLDVFVTFEGDNTVLMQLVGKSLLTGYRQDFGDLNPIGMASFFAGQVIEQLVERTAARELLGRIVDDLVPGREDKTDLLQRSYQQGLFRWRERHALDACARRLKGGIDRGMDPFDVFMEVQDHVITVGWTHIVRVMLDAFVAGIERCPDPEVAATLGKVCDLFVLWDVERHRGWFQEHGRISSTRSKLITRTINQLLAELRPLAVDLVDGFGVPDAQLTGSLGAR